MVLKNFFDCSPLYYSARSYTDPDPFPLGLKPLAYEKCTRILHPMLHIKKKAKFTVASFFQVGLLSRDENEEIERWGGGGGGGGKEKKKKGV